MNNINPLELMMSLKSGNPQQIATKIIEENFASDPMMQQLLQMAQKGDEKGVQNFATQFFNSHGIDFNYEMKNFMNTLKKM